MKKIIFLTLLFTTVIYSQKKFKDQPLVSEIFTADPSAHIFNGKIYIYPSHDIFLEMVSFIYTSQLKIVRIFLKLELQFRINLKVLLFHKKNL